MLGVVCGGCGELDPAVEQSVVFTATRPGGFVFDDASLSGWLVGAQVLNDSIVAVAACHSLLGHAGDWSVGPELVVSTRVDLVRAAEIVGSGAVRRDVAEQIESLLFEQAGDLDAAAIVQRSTVQTPVVEEYLRMRTQPPTDAALSRYAVYVQNETREVQRLVVVDRTGLASVDFDDLPDQYSSVELQYAGDDLIATLSKSDCASATADLDRTP